MEGTNTMKFTQHTYNQQLTDIITEVIESDPTRFGYATCFADLHDTIDANELLLACDDTFDADTLPDEDATDFAHLNTAIAHADKHVAWPGTV